MENVTMRDNETAGAINWSGNATIVSSRFVDAGGLQHFDGNVTVVNSIFDFGGNSNDGENSVVAGPGETWT